MVKIHAVNNITVNFINSLLVKFINNWIDDSDFIEIETSGTVSTPRLIRIPKINLLNSAIATNRYSKNIKVSLIDTLKEWDNFKSVINDKIEIKKIVDLSFFFPKYGFFMRLNYIKIFIYSFFPFIKFKWSIVKSRRQSKAIIN